MKLSRRSAMLHRVALAGASLTQAQSHAETIRLAR